MELSEFIQEQKALIDKFHTFWLRKHEEHPERFPLTLDKGQWDEQFWIIDAEDMS